MSRPLLPLLIALMAGIISAHLFRIPDLTVQICLAGALSLFIPAFHNQWRLVLHVSLLLSFYLLGILLMNLYFLSRAGNASITDYITEEKTSAEGMICDDPQVTPDRTELVLSSLQVITHGRYIPVAGRVLLHVREPVPFHFGDVVRFQSKLRLPRNFGNPGAFDYEKMLHFRGILARGIVNDVSGIIVIRRLGGSILRTWLEHIRGQIEVAIEKKAPETEGEIIKAMILGYQREIPKEVMEKFNRTGTTHIIAISGFNVGIVAFFSLFLIRSFLKSSQWVLLRWNVTGVANCFSIMIIIGYTFIAGAGISVVRASLMVVAFMISLLLNRERDMYNTLALAAFLILIVSPASLLDISFQLSFAAVASILFLTPRLTALLGPPPTLMTSWPTLRHRLSTIIQKSLRGSAIFFFVSLAATLGTLPLILLYFNRLSLITLAANLIVVPILGILTTPICLLIIVAVPLSPLLADWLIALSAYLVHISLSIIDLFSELPWSSVFVSTPTLPEIAAFYLLLVTSFFLLKSVSSHAEPPTGRRMFFLYKGVIVLVILFFVADGLYLYDRALHRGRLSLTAVDVGQGSAVLVRFPGGHRMLVDGGGFYDESFDVGKYLLAPFLWHERITSIDTVVLTHPHPDHLQGLLFVLENFRVREVWTNGDVLDSLLYQSFLNIIRERRITLRVMSDQIPIQRVAGVDIMIMNPHSEPHSPDALKTSNFSSSIPSRSSALPSSHLLPPRKGATVTEDTNERSLVLRLSFEKISFLLTGDIAEVSEARIIDANYPLRSDVLFVPHHGSLRSGSFRFLEQVRPQMAIISCGADNVFGFPHPEVLHRYELMRTRLFRTDQDGAVTVATDGRDLEVSVFRSNTF